jgi:putative nucleotidyltransferase with HDIG domain
MMKRILFVDDEPNVLAGLRRMLHPLCAQWEMVFVGGGKEALERLGEFGFDVLVTDVRMAGMSGVELLNQVRERFPETIRIVLSGTADSEAALRTATLAHQYLCKPCDAATFRATLERACSMRAMLWDPTLQTLISGIDKLPSLPSVYLKLNAVLGSDHASVKDIATVITQDMAMTAKVLQLVNSALFGISRKITSVTEAVTYLGVETVKSLSLSVMAFSEFRDPKLARFAEQLSAHSLEVGVLAREIAKSSRFATVTADDCFVAGLLHDIGKLILADNRPNEFRDSLRIAGLGGITSIEAEVEVFGTTHAEVGAHLLWLWGLPDCVTEAVALHHKPGRPAGGAVLAVHVADALIYNKEHPELDADSLGSANLMDQLPRWRKLQSESFAQRSY